MSVIGSARLGNRMRGGGDVPTSADPQGGDPHGEGKDFFGFTETAKSGYELDKVYPVDGLG